MKFVTHARTPDELRDEFLSDIARRQALIDIQIKHSTSARRAATLAHVRQELDSMLDYWSKIELRRAQGGGRGITIGSGSLPGVKE